jgi:hypothetical protein
MVQKSPLERNPMMKKYFVLTLVVVLLAIAVTPVLAAGGSRGGNAYSARLDARNGATTTFALAGTIASLDPAASTVTVKVVSGNLLVKSYIIQNLTIQTNDSTRFLLRNPDGVATPITFTDLVVGQKVSVNGVLANSVWTATRITADAKLVRLP